MRTAELSGKWLDYWVARAIGEEPSAAYPTDWSVGGPLIDRFRISVQFFRRYEYAERDIVDEWGARIPNFDYPPAPRYFDTTALRAAMRCLVGNQLGEEVPDGS